MDNNKQAPLVSVIMAAYNAQDYVEKAIESVLCQTMDDFELIIVDDGSRDETYAIAEAMAKKDGRICLLRNVANSGTAITRNTAINMARGRYLAFIDSDDVWYPEKLSLQLERITDCCAQMCYCSCSVINGNGERILDEYLVPETLKLNDLLKENYIWCSAMLVDTEQVRRFMFNTDFYHEDYVLSLELLRSGCRAVGCRETLLDWRYLEKSRSFNKFKSARNRWKIYREFLRLPMIKTLYYFTYYTVTGLRKYLRIRT